MEEIYDKELDRFLTITQSESYSYRDRTVDNANASDLTLAFAVDFSTPGERLTASAAGDKIIQIPVDINNKSAHPEHAAVAAVLQGILDRGIQNKDLVINIAGNGMSTLASHEKGHSAVVAQKYMNEFVHNVLKGVMDAGVKIKGLRSGGQTGADEAGINAGINLCIPVHAHFPKGYRRRSDDGTDRQYTKEEIRDYFKQSALWYVKCPPLASPMSDKPFYLSPSFLPDPLKEVEAIGHRFLSEPMNEGPLLFKSVNNAMTFLKAAYSKITADQSQDSLYPLSETQVIDNDRRMERSVNVFAEPVGMELYDNVDMTFGQKMGWSKIEDAVLKSVYIDSLSQNGDALALLLGTGLDHVDTIGLAKGQVLTEVRAELRGCLERQSSDGWCLVGKNILYESGDTGEVYNFIDTRGKVFSKDEWFAQAEGFDHGTAAVKTLDGFELSLHRTDSDKVASMLKEAREEAQTEAIQSRVSFRRM